MGLEKEVSRDELLILVVGRPAPQGSKSYRGNQRFSEASKYLPAWRKAIMGEVKSAFNATQDVRRFTEPVKVAITFFIDRPKNPKWPFPATTPDLDKLVRGVFDALTQGGAWVDDCLVVELFAREVWTGQTTDTYPVSGARIHISRL